MFDEKSWQIVRLANSLALPELSQHRAVTALASSRVKDAENDHNF